MPNPKTIEELLKMKPCPFEDGQKITGEDYEWFSNNYPAISSKLGVAVYEASLGYEIGETFKMPDGYYYLPPDKQLGLPSGLWLMKTIRELCNQLPYGVVTQYFHNTDFALSGSWRAWHPSDFRDDNAIIDIRKQPPNLYNPLDHKEEVPAKNEPYVPTEAELEAEADWFMNRIMVTQEEFIKKPVGHWCSVSKDGIYFLFNEAHYKKDMQDVLDAGYPIYRQAPDSKRILWHREQLKSKQAQPAKETETMELPWQDINEMPFFTEGLGNFVLCRRGVLEFYSDPELIDLKGVTMILLLTPPEAKTVEVPVEPERVSVQEFARNPVGKWFTVKGKVHYEYTKKHSNDDQTKHIVEIISAGHPIYASDPTAWLASQAEQEGKSE